MNLFQQYLQRPKSAMEYMADMDAQDLRALQLEGQRRQNALADLSFGMQRDEIAQKTRDRGMLSDLAGRAGGDTNKLVELLRSSGSMPLMQQADSLEKGILERRKTEADIGKTKADTGKSEAETLHKRLDVMKTLAGGVMANPTPSAAAFALDAYERMTGMQMPEERARVAQLTTPEMVKQWAAGHAMTADKLLPQIQLRNTGGTTDTLAIDPLTGKPTVTGSVTNTQSPDSKATERSAAASRAQAERHFQTTSGETNRHNKATESAPAWDATNQVWVDKTTRTVTPGVGPDGKALPPKAGAATEDERKAAGWVNQAQYAFDNMEQALRESPSAAKPPMLPAALRMMPFGVGDAAANAATPAARQKYEQASSSFAEAALRAATGAGVTAHEAEQKIRELTPQMGDKPPVIQQKRQALKVYLDSLRARAGRALPAAAPPAAPPAATPTVIDFADLK